GTQLRAPAREDRLPRALPPARPERRLPLARRAAAGLRRRRAGLGLRRRGENVAFRSRDVLRLVSDDVELIEACSGVDGTWGMQARFHEASLGVARKLLDTIERSGAEH